MGSEINLPLQNVETVWEGQYSSQRRPYLCKYFSDSQAGFIDRFTFNLNINLETKYSFAFFVNFLGDPLQNVEDAWKRQCCSQRRPYFYQYLSESQADYSKLFVDRCFVNLHQNPETNYFLELFVNFVEDPL